MKALNNQLVEWTINKAKTVYKDEVCLMIEHNTYTLEQDKSVRYVNGFISQSEKPIGLARTFIIDGIGYDLQQTSWEAFEKKANVKDYYITTLADSEILYYKSEEDKQRFINMQKKLQTNLENSAYMYERGLEWLSNAMEIYKTMMFEDELYKVRKAAGFIADYLSVSVACVNQTYFKSGVMCEIDQLRLMKQIPEHFIELYESIVKAESGDEIKSLCHDIINSTRKFFKSQNRVQQRNSSQPDYTTLAEWYQECIYYFKRVYHYCNEHNPTVAFTLTCGFQTDIDDISTDFGISGLDILSHFDVENLTDFAKQVKIAEQKIVSAIEDSGVRIDSYVTIEDFIKNN